MQVCFANLWKNKRKNAGEKTVPRILLFLIYQYFKLSTGREYCSIPGPLPL